MSKSSTIEYKVDRCGEQRLYVGNESSPESREQALLGEGWTRITTGSITEHWEQARGKVGKQLFNYDLCAQCTIEFSLFMDDAIVVPSRQSGRVSQSNDFKV